MACTEANKSNYTIRKISEKELDKLYDLFPNNKQLWIKYKNKRIREFDNKEIDIYIIEFDSAFIGELTINYISHDLKTEAIPNQRVYLQAFRLNSKYQGLGLGQKLIQFVLSDLEKQGYREFTIGVEDDNERAKHIYFKLGFTKAIDKGYGDEFDPSNYTLYMKSI